MGPSTSQRKGPSTNRWSVISNVKNTPSSHREVPEVPAGASHRGDRHAVEAAGVGHLDAERVERPRAGAVGIAPTVEARAQNPSRRIERVFDAHRVTAGGEIDGDAMIVDRRPGHLVSPDQGARHPDRLARGAFGGAPTHIGARCVHHGETPEQSPVHDALPIDESVAAADDASDVRPPHRPLQRREQLMGPEREPPPDLDPAMHLDLDRRRERGARRQCRVEVAPHRPRQRGDVERIEANHSGYFLGGARNTSRRGRPGRGRAPGYRLPGTTTTGEVACWATCLLVEPSRKRLSLP